MRYSQNSAWVSKEENMGFRSEDEIYNFDFRDAVIDSVEIIPEGITFKLDGLIVEPENSQNENYTKSYADTTKLRLSGGRIKKVIKDGYKRYDADNNLLESVDEQSLSEAEGKKLLENAKNAFLFAADVNDSSNVELFSYDFSIEIPSKIPYDTSVTDSYSITITFTKAIVTWNKYLNKVTE
jgi:hypothetical protein